MKQVPEMNKLHKKICLLYCCNWYVLNLVYTFVLSVMSLDEACATGGAGDETTEEGEVIPTQEDMDVPPGEDTTEGEPPTK